MNIEELRQSKEQLAEEVHNAWWEEKEKQGFHSPIDCPRRIEKPSENNERYLIDIPHCDNCHGDMIPYVLLEEHIKNYDRTTVEAVLKAISKLEAKNE